MLFPSHDQEIVSQSRSDKSRSLRGVRDGTKAQSPVTLQLLPRTCSSLWNQHLIKLRWQLGQCQRIGLLYSNVSGCQWRGHQEQQVLLLLEYLTDPLVESTMHEESLTSLPLTERSTLLSVVVYWPQGMTSNVRCSKCQTMILVLNAHWNLLY